MTIQKVGAVPFAQIANTLLRDRRLSYKARGIAAMVLSHSGDWEATTNWLVAQSDSDGITAVQSALNELSSLGYRIVRQEHGTGGRIHTVVYWYHEPQLDASGEPLGNLLPETPTQPETPQENRSPENLGTGKPDHRENRAPYRTPSTRTPEEPEHQETPPTPLQGPRRDPDFERFWEVYPSRVAKIAARKAWDKARRTVDVDTILAGAVRYRDDPNRSSAYTAHPATWLNQGRWEDEPLPARRTLTDMPLWGTGSTFGGGHNG